MKRTVSHILTMALLFSMVSPLSQAEPAELFTIDSSRETAVLAEHNGGITVAVSGRVGKYISKDGSKGLRGAVIRNRCATLTAEERLRHPECVLVREYELLKSGDLAERANLFVEGYWRTKALTWPFTNKKQARDRYGKTSDLRLTSVGYWRSRSYIGRPALGVADHADKEVVWGALGTWRDPQSGRVWLTGYNDESVLPTIARDILTGASAIRSGKPLQDVDMQKMEIVNYPIASLDAPPAGAGAWRVDPVHAQADADQDSVTLTRINAHTPGAIGENDLILYIRESPLVADPPPFIQVDPATLDDAGRALQKQLAMVLVGQDGGIPFDDKYLSVMHPACRKRLRERYEQAKAYNAKNGQPSQTRPVSPVTNSVNSISALRIVTCVYTNESVVWYGWTPSDMRVTKRRFARGRPGFDAPPIADDTPANFVRIVQRRAGKKYLLTLDSNPQTAGPEHLASSILIDEGVAESLVRAHLPGAGQ